METPLTPILGLLVVVTAFSVWACYRASADRELKPLFVLALVFAAYVASIIPLLWRYA